MPDLDRAGREIAGSPLFDPTPLAELQARAARIKGRRRALQVVLPAATALLLLMSVAVAWSANDRPRKGEGVAAGTLPSATASTTTVTAAADTSAPAAGQPSAGATGGTQAAGGTAATVAKSTASTTRNTTAAGATATTTKKSAVAPPVALGGIANVSATSTTAPSSAPQPGGVLTVLTATDITGFDPVGITNSASLDSAAASAVFDMLVSVEPGTGTIMPGVAESLTSSDGLTWTLKLRPNVKFSDGTAYDSAAVKFNWERLQNPANRAVRAGVAQRIASMDTVDSLTLRIRLKAKDVVFPSSAALMPFIASPAALQNRGASFQNEPIGAGPFVLSSWQKNNQMELTRNNSYWNAPQPYIDGLILKPVPDEAQRAAAFTNGQVNMVLLDTPQAADKLAKSGAGAQATIAVNGGSALFFNVRRAPFNDARARQAIAAAIDLRDYSKVVNGNLIEPLESIFRRTSPFYASSATQTKYDQAKAQQLFDQLAAERGGPLTFTITTSNGQNFIAAADYLRAALNQYPNVRVDVVTETVNGHQASCSNGSFENACLLSNGFMDPETGWTSLHVCSSPRSPSGYCNPAFDAAVADDTQTIDAGQRVAAMREAQRLFYADVPGLYLEPRTSWVFSAPNLRDVHFFGDGAPLFADLWVQSRAGATGSTEPPATTTTTRPATTTTRPPTTVAPTTTPKPMTTTTAATPATTTTAKPAPTTTAASPATTAAPTTTAVAAAPLPATTTTTVTAVTQVAQAPASSQRPTGISTGQLVLIALLAALAGVTGSAGFVLWRRERVGGW